MKIEVDYDGSYPNLCSGQLVVKVDGVTYEFPKYCLSSGGVAGFDHDTLDSYCEDGDWDIHDWPENFPEELKQPVTNAVNKEVPYGCCGGCI